MTIAEALAVEQITARVRMSLDRRTSRTRALRTTPGRIVRPAKIADHTIGNRLLTTADRLHVLRRPTEAAIKEQRLRRPIAGPPPLTTADRLQVLRRRTEAAAIKDRRPRQLIIARRLLRRMVAVAEPPPIAAVLEAAVGLPVEDTLAVVVPQPFRQATVPAAEAASTLSRTIPTDVANLISIAAIHAAFGRRFFEQFIAGV